MATNKQPDGSYILVMPVGNAKVSLPLFTSPCSGGPLPCLGAAGTAVGMACVWLVPHWLSPVCSRAAEFALQGMALCHPLSYGMSCRRHGAPRLTLATWQRQSLPLGLPSLATRRWVACASSCGCLDLNHFRFLGLHGKPQHRHWCMLKKQLPLHMASHPQQPPQQQPKESSR